MNRSFSKLKMLSAQYIERSSYNMTQEIFLKHPLICVISRYQHMSEALLDKLIWPNFPVEMLYRLFTMSYQ